MCRKWPKSETSFWKEYVITEFERQQCHKNYTNKIVHSSAMYMYYQNLNVIHKSSKKLSTVKSVKCFLALGIRSVPFVPNLKQKKFLKTSWMK